MLGVLLMAEKAASSQAAGKQAQGPSTANQRAIPVLTPKTCQGCGVNRLVVELN